MEFVLFTGSMGAVVGAIFGTIAKCIAILFGMTLTTEQCLALVGLCAALGRVVSIVVIVIDEHQSNQRRL